MIKFFKYVCFSFLVFAFSYLFAALILQNIYVGEKKLKGANKFLAYVSSSQIHTEFIFPVTNSLFDWTKLVPVKIVTTKISDPKYISIGWGSRDFFFNMKTWDDINFPVVLGAIFLPGESALHVEYLENLDSEVYPLFLTEKEYLDLIDYIKEFFILDQQQKVQVISDFSYYQTDKFFKSNHSYHMFNTCNMWTLNGLKKIDAKRPLWSPGKYGIENAFL